MDIYEFIHYDYHISVRINYIIIIYIMLVR